MDARMLLVICSDRWRCITMKQGNQNFCIGIMHYKLCVVCSILALHLKCSRQLDQNPTYRYLARPQCTWQSDIVFQPGWHSYLHLFQSIVGLSLWGTTQASVLMAAFGNTLLARDAHLDPMRAPLRDSFDLATPLRAMDLTPESPITTSDFDSLCTNACWDNVQVGFYFWYEWFVDLDATQSDHLSPIERTLVHLMFSPVPEQLVNNFYQISPFAAPRIPNLDLPLGLFFLNVIFHHSVFHNPGVFHNTDEEYSDNV